MDKTLQSSSRDGDPRLPQQHVALIDNYDSFTYNLRHLMQQLGARVTVLRNDDFELDELQAYDKLVFSPGPGLPAEAGRMEEAIRCYAGRLPILGVCLGEQAIGEVFGAKLKNLQHVDHGVQSQICITDHSALFAGLPNQVAVGRYHSWVVDRTDFPRELQVTAVSEDGEIMALRHRRLPVYGIQFHPESILTPAGHQMMANFLKAGC